MKLKKIAALFMASVLLVTGAGCAVSGKKSGGKEEKSAGTGETKEAGDPIQIATKPMTEQYILGEMLKLVIEDSTDYTAEITKGIGGGTNNIQPAMEKGEFDLYPEYTSSGWVMVLKHQAGEVDDDAIMDALNNEYKEKFNMRWISLYGFNNTYALAVRKDVADQYNLKTTSDLAKVSDQIIFGGNPDYIEREDGFGALCDVYGLNFKEVKDIDIGLKYEALKLGKIDVTNGFTTDAQLSRDDVVVLEDDKHLQVNYFCSTVVRNEALEEYPGLDKALEKMDGILTDADMAALNYQVEADGINEAEAAKNYLAEKGIIGE